MRIEPGQIWSDRLLPDDRLVEVLWTNDTDNVWAPPPDERYVLYMWLDSPVLRSKRSFIEAFEPLVGGEHG
jgi:hypothetical protein